MAHVLLFLCVANSARSQMAEGLARSFAHDGVEVFSAGSDPSRLNPLAAQALAEVGIEAFGHVSKGIAAIPLDRVDTVITLCEEEVCPTLPERAVHLHWPVPDPAPPGGEASIDGFRRARDEIRRRLEGWMSERGLSATA